MAARPGSAAGGAASGPPCVLVLSTVHISEDPRLRWRTVGALSPHVRVRYATKHPGPSRVDDHDWVGLPGGRLRRMLAGLRQACRRDVAVISLHDPELLPLGMLVRLLRRVPVVFDVHEDVTAQIRTKSWIPRHLRRPLARLMGLLLRVAERMLTITLAEPNYDSQFRGEHPVLPNHPDLSMLPDPQPTDGAIVYVGDVTELRGASLTVEAVARLDEPRVLRLIGRCEPALARRLFELADELGVKLELPGFLPHPEAMAVTARAAVGLCPLNDVPNYRRSLPTKMLEYLAMGVPTVGSDLEGTASVVDGLGGVVLLPPGDPEVWARGIGDVLDDPSMREEAAAQATELRRRFRFQPEDVWAVYAPLVRSAT